MVTVRVRSLVIAAALALASAAAAAGQTPPPRPTSCTDLLLPKETRNGTAVGQDTCRMIESDLTWQGHTYRRVDMGLSGAIDGYTPKDGPRTGYFTQAPDFVFPQVGNTSTIFHGVGRYEADKGTAMIVLYPKEASAWNGRMFVTVHGGSRSLARGNLRPWDRNLDPANPAKDLSKYELLMLQKGYAVAKTRRNTDSAKGDVVVTLDDGTVVNRNLTELPQLIIGFAKVAEHLLAARLGRQPDYTYWYGRSAGARPGRLVNYQDINRDANGRPVIDGILSDDSGAGLWLPVVEKGGRDVLFSTPAERERFVKQIDLHHLLYVNETEDNPPSWVSRNYLENKRRNAVLLREKGLGAKHRAYEIHGVSHIAGEDDEVAITGDMKVLELTRLMDGIIDLLDAWVTKGVEPPPSMSDWAGLGDANGDGAIDHPAIALPEVACPLGLYFQYPTGSGRGGITVTGFAPFDGKDLEPLNGLGVFVDMNLNRYRDRRETATEAWRRLGLLGANETFTREKYTACVEGVVRGLEAARLIGPAAASSYRQQAATQAVSP